MAAPQPPHLWPRAHQPRHHQRQKLLHWGAPLGHLSASWPPQQRIGGGSHKAESFPAPRGSGERRELQDHEECRRIGPDSREGMRFWLSEDGICHDFDSASPRLGVGLIVQR
jgi:hypothetical protein